MKTPAINPLLCDTDTGICEIPEAAPSASAPELTEADKPLRLLYFTDPICSSCWGIEPQLRKLKLEWGNSLEIDYRMGGLLPDWSYNSGGISKPSDVAHHWDEVSVKYDMPIDGDVWLEDPLHSSYPPSIAFKAAQLQDKGKAIRFLRAMREQLFLRKQNICRWEHLHEAALSAGLDPGRLKTDAEGEANRLFGEDLQLARQLGVRGFPTIFFRDNSGREEKIYGTRPYTAYEEAIATLAPGARRQPYAHDWESLFLHYPTLTAREFAELSDTGRAEAETLLETLCKEGKLEKLVTKNGSLWMRTEQPLRPQSSLGK